MGIEKLSSKGQLVLDSLKQVIDRHIDHAEVEPGVFSLRLHENDVEKLLAGYTDYVDSETCDKSQVTLDELRRVSRFMAHLGQACSVVTGDLGVETLSHYKEIDDCQLHIYLSPIETKISNTFARDHGPDVATADYVMTRGGFSNEDDRLIRKHLNALRQRLVKKEG